MVDNTENSSLHLLLVISGAVLLVAVGGWYLLEQEPALPTTPEFVATPEPADAEIQTSEEEETTAEPAMDLDAELLKAQLAAKADVLVFPRAQSALRYYGNIIERDPQHAVAVAEMDSVLARVAQTVNDHLARGEFAQAHEIATIVANYRPEHELVLDTQGTLAAEAEALVQQAIAHAQGGDDAAADTVLTEAEALPGQNQNYFTGIRNTIVEIQQVRQAAEEDRIQRSQLADEEAKDAWVNSTRMAISEGNLISPEGASATDLLAEENEWDEERGALNAELVQALIATASLQIESTNPAPAEALLNSIADMDAESDELDTLRNALDTALIEIESTRVVRVAELVAINKNPPKYPKRAEERGVSGSVDVEFTVTTEGLTSDIVVIASEPTGLFDISAVTAVRNWEFEPREFRGQLINQRVNTRLVFRLN